MKSICVIGPLKKAKKGCRFWLDEDVKVGVMRWFQQLPKQFVVEGDPAAEASVERVRAYLPACGN